MTERVPVDGDAEGADILEESSLSDPEVVELAAAASATAVTDVLGRLSRLDQRVAQRRRSVRASAAATATEHGPLAEWRRELDALLHSAGPVTTDQLPERLCPFVTGEFASAEADRRLLEDADLARDLVETLGGDWSTGHHRSLLRAARIQAGLEKPRATARRSVSGFTGASHQARPLRAVSAPVETLPVVRGRDSSSLACSRPPRSPAHGRRCSSATPDTARPRRRWRWRARPATCRS